MYLVKWIEAILKIEIQITIILRRNQYKFGRKTALKRSVNNINQFQNPAIVYYSKKHFDIEFMNVLFTYR